jgi:hypothetical protein
MLPIELQPVLLRLSLLFVSYSLQTPCGLVG